MTQNNIQGSFVINGQYIKDLSFEAPNGAGTFMIEGEGVPNLNFDLNATNLEGSVYEVSLKMQIDLKVGEVAIYVLQLDYRGIFTIEGIEGDDLSKVLMVHCPSFMYPYIRSIVYNVITASAFAPPIMNPIDFLGIYNAKFGNAEKVPEGALKN